MRDLRWTNVGSWCNYRRGARIAQLLHSVCVGHEIFHETQRIKVLDTASNKRKAFNLSKRANILLESSSFIFDCTLSSQKLPKRSPLNYPPTPLAAVSLSTPFKGPKPCQYKCVQLRCNVQVAIGKRERRLFSNKHPSPILRVARAGYFAKPREKKTRIRLKPEC